MFIEIFTLYNPIKLFAIVHPTPLANLVVELGIVIRSYFIPHFTGLVITYPLLGTKLIHVSKRGLDSQTEKRVFSIMLTKTMMLSKYVTSYAIIVWV